MGMITLIDEPPQRPTEEQLEWWKHIAQNNGPRIFVTSRLHETDEPGHIMNDDGWDVLEL
jgi:hypothetical protein